jgi:hypothetical protein
MNHVCAEAMHTCTMWELEGVYQWSLALQSSKSSTALTLLLAHKFQARARFAAGRSYPQINQYGAITLGPLCSQHHYVH